MYGKTSFTEQEIAELIALEELCNKRDGIDLRLGLGELHKRCEEKPRDFVYEQDGKRIGYLTCMVFGPKAEISGMVHPEYRRQGVFGKLLKDALAQLKGQGVAKVLFCADRKSDAGKRCAESIGAVYANSEYTLPLTNFTPTEVKHSNLTLREATEDDTEFIIQCSAQAFGDDVEEMREIVDKTSGRPTYVAELDREPVGAIRVFLYEDRGAYPHLFSVLPEQQGRGYGRQILTQTIQLLQSQGRDRIEIDVECDNENALGLYLSLGFAIGSAYDFYRMEI